MLESLQVMPSSFIAILYLTAPAVASFARLNLIDSIQDKTYQETPDWFKNWESIGLIAWQDKNLDGKITYASGDAFIPQKPQYVSREEANEPRPLSNKPNSNSSNEVYIDRDIVVLANPEIAGLPGWVHCTNCCRRFGSRSINSCWFALGYFSCYIT